MEHIWTGKKYLKLERRSPWYSIKSSRDICLKQYFNIFGWTLALRLVKTGYKPEAISRANNLFGYVSNKLAKNIFESEGKNTNMRDFSKVLLAKGEYNRLYCYNLTGDLLGSLGDMSWMIVEKYSPDFEHKGVAYNKEDNSFVGYSHRCKQKFKIGDRIFDENYDPKEEDYEEWEWAGFLEKQTKAQKESDAGGWGDVISIKEVVPFKKRGAETIETSLQARTAAHNFSNYIS
jgi:hypothetical protein